MRNMLFAGVAGAAMILGVNAASAADLYTPPPAEVIIAPAPVGGWYVGIHGGAAFPQKLDTNGSVFAEDLPSGNYLVGGHSGTNSFDTGWLVGGTVGYEMGNGLRGELEVTYLSAGNKRVRGSWGYDAYDANDNLIGFDDGSYSFNARGSLGATFVLANVWYDFNNFGAFKPYVGGGIGVAFVDQDIKVAGWKLLDDSTTSFAFQAGAGVKWAMSDAVDLDIGYRFKGALDTKLSNTRGWNDGITDISHRGRSNDDLFIHTVQVGLTFKFGGY